MIASGSPSILDGAGSESSRIAGVWWLMFGLAAAVYVIVAAFVVVAIVRGRRATAQADEPGPSRIDRWFIWGGGIGVPVVILAVLGAVTVTTTRDLRQPAAGELHIHVSAERWWWDVTYTDVGIHTANEIHVPVGQPIDIALDSDNVAHSFWVPQLAGKVDVIPGQTNHLRFRADRAGTYLGECAEFCGIQHAHMGFVVIAEDPETFGRWEARRTSGAGTTPSDETAAQGALLFASLPCAGCHTVSGSAASGTLGPDLSDFGARQTIGAAAEPNTPENLSVWIRDAQHVKPGSLMPTLDLTDDQQAKLVAYLESLR